MLGPRFRFLSAVIAVAYPVLNGLAATPDSKAPARDEATSLAADPLPTQPVAASTPDHPKKIDQITVTAQKLKEARINLSPKIGTTVYSVGDTLIDSIGQGAAAPFDEVLLRFPGVDKDSKASGSDRKSVV